MAKSPAPRNSGPGWRGSADVESAETQHRWQSADPSVAAESTIEKTPSDGRGRRIAFGALLIAALILLGFYVRSLLLAPVQTPVLLLSAGPYPEPFAPNGWAREDANGLEDLDGKTLSVSQVSGIEEFNAQLKDAFAQQKHSKVVIIAVSAHGAVNRNGEPCLMLPTASPVKGGSWVKLSDVLGTIRQSLPDNTRKLLVLDCNRVRAWWPQGTLDNTFTDSLEKSGVLKKSGVKNLVVLNSVSPGERGWAAPELKGSVFGHFLRKGIARYADANKDRSVSLRELHSYVKREVNNWSTRHYGESQRPMLYFGETDGATADVDFHVAWALRGDLPDPKEWDPAVKSDEIAALWRFHDQTRSHATYRYDPLAWSSFQQKLLRLEATASAGEAYKPAAARLLGDLNLLKQRLEKQRDRIRSNRPLHADFGDFTQDTEGALRTDVLADSRRRDDAQFQRMLDRYQVRALWKNPAVVDNALDMRRHAWQAAAPADLRAFRGVRQGVADTDRRRRLAEDRLFAGESAASANLETTVGSLTAAYRNDAQQAGSLAAALQLRDRVHAELPWLLAWLSHQATTVKWNTDLKHDEINRGLERFVQDFRQFRNDLRTGKPFDAQKISGQFAELGKHYDEECERLAKMSKPNVAVLRRIQAVLSVPLVPGRLSQPGDKGSSDLRAILSATARDMAVRIHRTPPSGDDAKEPSSRDQLALRSKWNLLRALFLDTVTADGERDAHLVEAAIRGELSTLASDVGQLSNERTTDPATFRDKCVGTAQRWRLALALPMPKTDRDPVHFLRRFELQQNLVWQAERTLRDFRGNAGGMSKELYFVDAAQSQLAAAQASFAHFAGFQKQQKELASQLDRWKVDARTVFKADADAGLRIEPAANVAVNVHVTQNHGVAFASGDVRPPDAAPAGVANVSLWRTDKRVGTAVRRLDVVRKDPAAGDSPPKQSLAFSVDSAQATANGGALYAKVVFRGHEFPSTLNLRSAAGTTSEVRPETSGAAKITLRGSAAKPLSIVFILDCSYSMTNVVRGDASRKTRHQVALAALKSLLGKLAERGNARVGVVFYGHRVAWNASKPTELLRQTDYARRFPDELLPLEDVEAVLPLGRFDDRVSKRVDRLLGTIKPWGETPLYLAIDEALRQFAGETGEGERRIVVITDGVNNQRVPRDLQLTKSQAAKVTSRADVERAIRRQTLPIHILGFEMDSAEERGAQVDFRRIASQSKGTYHPAVDAETLLGRLTSLVGAAEFQLVGPGDKLIEKAELGKTLAVSVPGPGVVTLDVKSGSAGSAVELHGGESLQLVIGGDGTSIQTVPYEERDPVFVPLIDPATTAESGTAVGLHAASRAADNMADVDFTVSLQRPDHSFSPRLPLVWIEVTPLSAGNQTVGKPYYFVDTAYAANTPVPVLKLRAVNWPVNARQASFRVWCRQKPVNADSVALSRLLSGGAKKSGSGKAAMEPYRVAGSTLRADVSSATGGLVLRIVQRTDGKSATLQPLKVEVAGVAAKKIVRQFDGEHGIAVHRFEFDAGKEPQLSAATLRITTRDAAQQNAWSLARPTTVSVRARGELLPLTVPPLGTRK